MRDPFVPRPTGARRRQALLAAALVPVAASLAQASTQVVRIGRTDYVSPLTDIEERVLGHAFDRIGVRCQFVPIPLLRLIEMANDGQIDADIGRIPEVADRFPNLIRLPTPICQSEVAVYGRTADFARRTRSEIAGMSIGIVRGVFVLSKHTQGMKVIEVQNFEAITNMMANQRIDAAVAIYLDTEVQLRNRQVAEMVRWPYLWASEPLHFLLHKSHAALVSPLEEALARMAREGLIQRYYAEGLKKIGVAPLLAAQAAPR